MKLLFLSKDNLKNNIFIKELVFNFAVDGPVLLVHDFFNSVNDTRFVSKRISTLLSDQLVVNNWFSGDQRNILGLDESGNVSLKKEFLEDQLKIVNVLILNPLVKSGDEIIALENEKFLNVLLEKMPLTEVVLFPGHNKSPLGAEDRRIENREESERLLEIYGEEEALLRLAASIAPVTVSNPSRFSK